MENYRVIFTRPARHDLEEIRDYIARASADQWTADRFCARLLDVALSLDQAPERGGRLRTRRGTRFLVMRPYLILYRIITDKQTVLVLRLRIE